MIKSKKIEGNYEITETSNAKIIRNINTVPQEPKIPKEPEPTNGEIKALLIEIKELLQGGSK